MSAAASQSHAAVAPVGQTDADGVLSGLLVLDLTIALAGPFATLLFASMGADVIRVEAPDGSGDISRWNPPFVGEQGAHFAPPGPEDISASTLNRSQGKRSVTLNLKTPEGQRMFLEMARKADVVIENFSSGTAERLGVGYDAVCAANPAIVYCSISGFGRDNPYPDLKTMDIIVQAMSGLMEATGTAGGPPVRVGIPIGDLTGSLYASTGVLAALLRRHRTGSGRHVDISLVDCLASLVSVEHFEAFHRAGIETRTGNTHARLTPFGVYPAADGYVAIAAHTDEWVASLFAAVGRPDLARDPRFGDRGSRVRHTREITDIIEAWTKTLARDEVVRILHEEHGLPAVPVRSPEEALSDGHVRSRGAVVPISHPRFGVGAEPIMGTGLPIRFSDMQPENGRPAPLLGEHNEQVYGELLGLNSAALEALRSNGVI